MLLMRLKKTLSVIYPLFLILILSTGYAQQFNQPEPEEDIVLSVGDRIQITYIDVDRNGNPVEKSNIYTIRPDGTIFHELLGNIPLSGFSLAEAEEVLYSKLSNYFREPSVAIQIIEKKLNKVLLYGEVAKIGVFPVKPETRVAEFIIQNGGTTPEADLSRITITRKDGTTENFDMLRYLYTSQASNNIILKDGDKVIVPRMADKEKYSQLDNNYILQYGNVIEITIMETARASAKSLAPETYVIDQNGEIYHRLFGKMELGGVTVEKARALLTDMAEKYYSDPVVNLKVVKLASSNVFIFGEVARPGIYPIEGNVRLAEFIADVGGLTDQADINEIIVTRRSGEVVHFNLERYLLKRDDSHNIYLTDGDRIIVQNKNRGFAFWLSEKMEPYQTILRVLSTALTIYLIFAVGGR